VISYRVTAGEAAQLAVGHPGASQPRPGGEGCRVITTLSVADEQVINYFRLNGSYWGQFSALRIPRSTGFPQPQPTLLTRADTDN
jgi:hypothetical protein